MSWTWISSFQSFSWCFLLSSQQSCLLSSPFPCCFRSSLYFYSRCENQRFFVKLDLSSSDFHLTNFEKRTERERENHLTFNERKTSLCLSLLPHNFSSRKLISLRWNNLHRKRKRDGHRKRELLLLSKLLITFRVFIKYINEVRKELIFISLTFSSMDENFSVCESSKWFIPHLLLFFLE